MLHLFALSKTLFRKALLEQQESDHSTPAREGGSLSLLSPHPAPLPKTRENPPGEWGKGLKSNSLASTAVLQWPSGLSRRWQEPTWAKVSQIHMLWGNLHAHTHFCSHAHTQGHYSKQSTTSSSLAPRSRLPWHIRACAVGRAEAVSVGVGTDGLRGHASVPGGPALPAHFGGGR